MLPLIEAIIVEQWIYNAGTIRAEAADRKSFKTFNLPPQAIYSLNNCELCSIAVEYINVVLSAQTMIVGSAITDERTRRNRMIWPSLYFVLYL